MRTVTILAVLLVARAASLAVAGSQDNGFSSAVGGRDVGGNGSGGVHLELGRSLWDTAYQKAIAADYQRALDRAARDAGHYGCGCAPDRSGGQAGAAGF